MSAPHGSALAAMPEPAEPTQCHSLCDLPNAVITTIISKLGYRDSIALACTCSHLLSASGPGWAPAVAAWRRRLLASRALEGGAWRSELHERAPFTRAPRPGRARRAANDGGGNGDENGEGGNGGSGGGDGGGGGGIAAPPPDSFAAAAAAAGLSASSQSRHTTAPPPLPSPLQLLPPFAVPRAAASGSRRAAGAAGGPVPVEYGEFFRPPDSLRRRSYTYAHDGRMTLLAGLDANSLAAHHPPASGATVLDELAAGPLVLELDGLPGHAGCGCLVVSPQAPPEAHLAPAAWPQPPVYRPPCLLPPLGPVGRSPRAAAIGEHDAPRRAAVHAAWGEVPTAPEASGPQLIGAVEQAGEEEACGWCGGALDGAGLCELGCGGGAAVMPAAHGWGGRRDARACQASLGLLASVALRRAAPPSSGPDTGPPRPPPGRGPNSHSRGRIDDGGGGDASAADGRLTYLDCSHHEMPYNDGVIAALIRGAAGGAGAGAAAAGQAPAPVAGTPLEVMLTRGHGRHLRHLVALGAAVRPREELSRLGVGDCCARLTTLDLSACSTAPATAGGSGSGSGSSPAMASPAALEFGLALREAVGRLGALTVLRLQDLDLRGFFCPDAAAATAGPTAAAPTRRRRVGDAAARAAGASAASTSPHRAKQGRGEGAEFEQQAAMEKPYQEERALLESVAAGAAAAGAAGAADAAGAAAATAGAESVTGENSLNGGGGGTGGGGAQQRPPEAAWVIPLGHTLSSLRHLDLSGSLGVGPTQLAAVLAVAIRLTHFGAARCRELAPYGGDAAAAAAMTAVMAGRHPRCLRSLSLGWGFSDAAVRRLCGGGGGTAASLASPPSLVPPPAAAATAAAAACLMALDLGVGAAVDDAGLAAAAAVCPHLQQLRLTLCAVTGAGLGAALAACPKLHVLHVTGCTGPFRRQELLGPLGWLPPAAAAPAAAAPAAAAPAAAEAEPGSCVAVAVKERWAMSDLQLVANGRVELYDEDLLSLLYGRPMYGTAAACCAGEVGSPHGGGDGGSEAALAPEPPYGGGRLRHLHTLALVGLSVGLSDTFLSHLRDHGGTGLRHVRLEGCGGGGGGGGSGSGGGGGSGGSGGGGGGFREGALMSWLTRCGSLVNLRLRHCCQLGADAVARLRDHCPRLEVLMLDHCDLPPCGFDLLPSPYGALSYVMLARCRADEGGLPRHGAAAGSGGGGGGEPAAAAGGEGACWWLPLERDVKIIRLCDGAVDKEVLFAL